MVSGETTAIVNNLEWHPIRPDLTTGVTGALLAEGEMKAVLTVVEPGGSFSPHKDAYSHLFYLLEGTLEVLVDEEIKNLSHGQKIGIPAGILHAYRNPGPQPATLISFNISNPHGVNRPQ